MVNILVLATGLRLQYRTLRCASATGASVFVVGNADARGLARSAACAGFHLLEGGSNGFEISHLSQIERICSQRRIDWILPSDPQTTRFLTIAKDRLGTPCFPVPSTEAFDLLDDKHRFAQLCRRLDIPHPPTELIADRDELLARLGSDAFPFPVVAKPLSMWGSRGVVKIDRGGGTAVAERIDYVPILLQTYVAGRDVCSFFFCRNGSICVSVTYAKGPDGITFLRDERVDREAAKIARHTEFDGVLGFDLRVDANGRLAFIECNPRFWHNMDVAMRAGVNFVALGIDRTSAHRSVNTPDRILVRSPAGSMKRIVTPWKLEKGDIETIRYICTDPVAIASMVLQRFGAAGRAASGQGL